MSSWYLKIAPVQEPVSVAEVKQHLRVDFADDDALISGMITDARWTLERIYRRACITQSRVIGLDYFGQGDSTWGTGWTYPLPFLGGGSGSGYAIPGWGYSLNPVVELHPPLQSVTAVTYLDPAGNLQTFAGANYMLDTHSEPGRISPVIGQRWPITAALPGAAMIEFICGYTDPTLVPGDIKRALKLLIGAFYENREQYVVGTRLTMVELPIGVRQLMMPYTRPLVR